MFTWITITSTSRFAWMNMGSTNENTWTNFLIGLLGQTSLSLKFYLNKYYYCKWVYLHEHYYHKLVYLDKQNYHQNFTCMNIAITVGFNWMNRSSTNDFKNRFTEQVSLWACQDFRHNSEQTHYKVTQRKSSWFKMKSVSQANNRYIHLCWYWPMLTYR